jgi:methylated-DNA-[protein]-cysteine S-methyltransferase
MRGRASCYAARVMETLFYRRSQSPVGSLVLAASSRGLVRLEFEARVQKLDDKKFTMQESEATLTPYLSELNEYFAGERREFSFPLDLRGTDFQLACWRALLAIPYGETCSYRDIAEAIDHPHAYRAVGMANNRNPIAIVVPCHRVIASSGSLCGYGGGLDLKRALLDLEQSQIDPENSRYDDYRDNDYYPGDKDGNKNRNRRQFRLPLAIGA